MNKARPSQNPEHRGRVELLLSVPGWAVRKAATAVCGGRACASMSMFSSGEVDKRPWATYAGGGISKEKLCDASESLPLKGVSAWEDMVTMHAVFNYLWYCMWICSAIQI